MATGKKGQDPRMLFSWYAADYVTDPQRENLSPEGKANASAGSWEDPGYLIQQQTRLPSHKYRRLHLNLPGSPEGSAYDAGKVMDSIARGVSVRLPERGVSYFGFVDMSGGSIDDATLGIAHRDKEGSAILDRVVDQGQRPPFDPRKAVERFVGALKEYGLRSVTGDKYAGETFRQDFQGKGIAYHVSELTKSEIYEEIEPLLNGGRVILLDHPNLESQFLGLVWRGGKIDHPNGEHDDYANGAAGALNLASKNQVFNPRAIPTAVGRGIGAEIRQAGLGCDDRGPFDRSSRLSVGSIPTHWNYNGDDDDD
jgi:hypothetical protein